MLQQVTGDPQRKIQTVAALQASIAIQLTRCPCSFAQRSTCPLTQEFAAEQLPACISDIVHADTPFDMAVGTLHPLLVPLHAAAVLSLAAIGFLQTHLKGTQLDRQQ